MKFDRLLHNFRAQISIFGHIRMKTAEFTPDLGKTESSMKPIPMGPELIKVLQEWKLQTRYAAPDDWVFASARTGGKRPMWGENMIRKPVRRALRKLGIYKAIGWHTFRHSYSTLLRSLGTDIKVQQDLLRHSSIRLTLDTYTQAVTSEKRAAQNAVLQLLTETNSA